MEEPFSTLKLIFIGDIENSIFSGFRILNKVYDFKTKEIPIHNDLFETLQEKKNIDFQLILKEEENKDKLQIESTECFHLNIFKGINKAYCFISENFDYLFDICCLNEKVNISYKDIEFNEFNELEDDTRSRIVLINVPSKVAINKEKKLLLYTPLGMSKENSIQISFFDSSGQNYSVKAISNEEITEEFSMVKYLKESKNKLKNFLGKLENLIKKNRDDKVLYLNLTAHSELKIIKINFATRKESLKNEFNDDELFDLFYIYILWLECSIKYFPNGEETKEFAEFKCNLTIDVIFDYITKFYEKYKSDKNLLNYQRILLFYSNVIFFLALDNEKDYDECKLEYVSRKNIEQNSVFGLSFKFLEDFIDNLNSKSDLFYPLLLLDSWLYYKNEKTVYGFGFQSCDNIKQHLKELIPDVFFIHKKENIDEIKGFNYKGLRTIFLNKSAILKNYEGNLNKNDLNIKITKKYAIRASIFLMHECFGNNKSLYKQKYGVESPRYFYNKNKRFITMIPKNVQKIDYSNENNFYINQKRFEVESGNFLLEYFFGFYDNEFVIDLIYQIPDVGKLIDNVKYFTSEKLDVLKNYIIYKYVLSRVNIEFIENENTILENDIEEMSQLLKKNSIRIDKTNIQKKDQSSKFLFVEIDDREIKNYSYYSQKFDEA